MACFLVPAAEAVVTTVVKKATKSKVASEASDKHPFLRSLNWLNNMLWGGSALLAFEHVWHGEVTPWFPFLTGAAVPGSAAEMLHETATSGVAMAALVTVVWIGMVLGAGLISKKPLPAIQPSLNGGKVR